VTGGLEGDERIVEALRLPVSLAFAPTSGVPGDSVDELVMPDILRALVGITAARARSADKRKADGVVVRFV
jgi:hypothetical protein